MKSNYLCDGYKMFFEHADDTLKELAEIWKRKYSFTGEGHAVESNV